MEQQTLAVKRLSRAEAQQLVRRSRLDPLLYQSLVNELQTLSAQPEQAISVTLPPETRYATMKARLQRMAKRMHLQLTIRKTPEGLVCWQETPEEEKQRVSRSQKTQEEIHNRNNMNRLHTTEHDEPMGVSEAGGGSRNHRRSYRRNRRFPRTRLRLLFSTSFQLNCGVRAGLIKGAKVADLLRICGQAFSWGVVRRTAVLNGLIDSFCA
jgi:hypothetical protein